MPEKLAVRGVSVGTTGGLLIDAFDWIQVTLITGATGVNVATEQGTAVSGSGMPLPVDQPVTLIVPPGSYLWGAGDDGSIVGVAEQPLPWNVQFMQAIGEGLGVLERLLEDEEIPE